MIQLHLLPNDYDKRESVEVSLENCVVAKTIQMSMGNCPLSIMTKPINIVSKEWGLNPSRTAGLNTIKRILAYSIINN